MFLRLPKRARHLGYSRVGRDNHGRLGSRPPGPRSSRPIFGFPTLQPNTDDS